MFRPWRMSFLFVCLAGSFAAAQNTPDSSGRENLGEVYFPVSCKPEVQAEFNRAVALLHSFTYSPAEEAFRNVAKSDPKCAMAHWGIAMTHFHQLWDPPIPPGSAAPALKEIEEGVRIRAGSDRERKFIESAALIFRDADSVPYPSRAASYEQAMSRLAHDNQKDLESQVFYALALLANASPADKTHARQKQAADLLEPLFQLHSQHPGIAHYLIHACDNAELAERGLSAAHQYSKIAPSAPHALHMPSHIFTRLGLWDDSIASNLSARDAAHKMGDTGEELHAMDYLVYAYLQSDRDSEAWRVIQSLKKPLDSSDNKDFKAGYAATAMPIRYVIERHQWTDASVVPTSTNAPPHVAAIAVWAHGIGFARSGRADEAGYQVEELQKLEKTLTDSGNDYWAAQVRVMRREVAAWSAQASGKAADAVTLMRQAADEEDAVEKLPVTPGPILPAREQLGELLLQQDQPVLASQAFETALVNAPGRRGALRGAAVAKQLAAQKH